MIKVAFVNVMEGYSGGEVVVERIIKNIDHRHFECYLFTRKTRLYENLKDHNIHVVLINSRFQLKKKRGIGAIYRISRNILISAKYVYSMKYKYHIDIIHSNTLTSNIYFSIWAKIFGIKLVAYAHDIKHGGLYKILYKYIACCAYRVIVISEAVKINWLHYGVKPKKLVKIYNGIPNDFF